jgi:hypothetical protein
MRLVIQNGVNIDLSRNSGDGEPASVHLSEWLNEVPLEPTTDRRGNSLMVSDGPVSLRR